MMCPKCMSSNVNIQVVSEQPQRDGLPVIMWILLALCTCGMLVLFVPLLSKPGSKITSRAVCQNCGHQWPVTGRGATQPEKFVLRDAKRPFYEKLPVICLIVVIIMIAVIFAVPVIGSIFGLI